MLLRAVLVGVLGLAACSTATRPDLRRLYEFGTPGDQPPVRGMRRRGPSRAD